MILFDALHVNHGGSAVLLDVILEELYPFRQNVHFLLDERLRGRLDIERLPSATYLPATLVARHTYYRRHQHRFKRVFCFSGIPPTCRIHGECLTYLQNTLLIQHPGWNQPNALKRAIQQRYMSLYGQNVDGWIVQTEHMRQIACRFYKLNPSEVMVAPFFKDPLQTIPQTSHDGIHFLYASDGYAHKNHLRLLDAFEILAGEHPGVTLHVTLANHFSHLKRSVRQLQDKGVPVLDHGFVPYSEVLGLYANADVVVFPSLTESLGIGLIESAQIGRPVIASNRPYVFELIDPSLTFDPLDVQSIWESMRMALKQPLNKPTLRIRSHVTELVNRIVGPISILERPDS
jgi:glycosyltransferase involved in cell wall biosynthesis